MRKYVERNDAVRCARAEGRTLKSIGAEFGISKERVRQILAIKGDTIVKGNSVANYRKAYSEFAGLIALLKASGLEFIYLDRCLILLNACRCASYEDCQTGQGLSVRSEVVDGVVDYRLQDGRLLGFSSPVCKDNAEVVTDG